MRAVCGVFRVAERCFSLGSILAAAASPAHAALWQINSLLFPATRRARSRGAWARHRRGSCAPRMASLAPACQAAHACCASRVLRAGSALSARARPRQASGLDSPRSAVATGRRPRLRELPPPAATDKAKPERNVNSARILRDGTNADLNMASPLITARRRWDHARPPGRHWRIVHSVH